MNRKSWENKEEYFLDVKQFSKSKVDLLQIWNGIKMFKPQNLSFPFELNVCLLTSWNDSSTCLSTNTSVFATFNWNVH